MNNTLPIKQMEICVPSMKNQALIIKYIRNPTNQQEKTNSSVEK